MARRADDPVVASAWCGQVERDGVRHGRLPVEQAGLERGVTDLISCVTRACRLPDTVCAVLQEFHSREVVAVDREVEEVVNADVSDDVLTGARILLLERELSSEVR